MDIKLIIYYLCIASGGLSAAVADYRLGRKKELPKKTLKMFLVLALFFGFFGAWLMGQTQNFIMSLTGLPYSISRMRIFGGLLFTPVFLYFPVKYLAGDFRLISDIIAPGAFLILGCSKIGCAIYGCCYGIPFSHGVSTPFEEHLCFPVQALESVLCFVLFAAVYYLFTTNRLKKGALYPLSLILYGTVRFLVEFLRYYPEAEKTYFFGINFWQAVSIISIFTGIIWTAVTVKTKSRA